MSIQPIPPTSGATTAGQLVSRAYQNDQALAAWLGDHDGRLTDLESGTPGTGIEYVSGVVTPDPAVAVHEYFTTGAATIDGVAYAAEQAVVLFRVAGSWVHKVVDLPIPTPPPGINFLQYQEKIDGVTPFTEWTFEDVPLGTPRAGRIVSAVIYVHTASVTSVEIAGAPATVTGQNLDTNGRLFIAYAVVPEGESGDVAVTLAAASNILMVDFLEIVSMSTPHYSAQDPGAGTGVTWVIDAAPVGSITVVAALRKAANLTTLALSGDGLELLDEMRVSSYDPTGQNFRAATCILPATGSEQTVGVTFRSGYGSSWASMTFQPEGSL